MQNTQNVNYREINRWANLRLLMVAAALVVGVVLLLRAWRTTTDATIDANAQPTVQAVPRVAEQTIPDGSWRGADGRIRPNRTDGLWHGQIERQECPDDKTKLRILQYNPDGVKELQSCP